MIMTVRSKFRASHVFLTRISERTPKVSLEILVPLERRRHEGLVLGVLGGMRDFHEDDPIQTASREADEETGGALEAGTLACWLEDRSSMVWVQQAKSAVWVVPPEDKVRNLDSRVRWGTPGVEAEGFRWVDWRAVRPGAELEGQRVGEFLAMVLSHEEIRCVLEALEDEVGRIEAAASREASRPTSTRPSAGVASEHGPIPGAASAAALPPHLIRLVREQARQVLLFEQWASAGSWGTFHDSHYDWWTFPIDEHSKRPEFRVDAADVDLLSAHPGFLVSLQRACELLMLSWGVDVATAAPIRNPAPRQAWANWPIRLLKMTRSAQIFGLKDCFNAGRVLARRLHKEGRSLSYNGRSFTAYFLDDNEVCPEPPARIKRK